MAAVYRPSWEAQGYHRPRRAQRRPPAVTIHSPTPPVSQTRGSTTTGVITTGSFTPAANSVLIVTAQSFHDDHADPFDWDITDSAGLTWTLIDQSAEVQVSNGNFLTQVIAWWAPAGSSPSSMTITIDPRLVATGNQDFGSGINVAEVRGNVSATAPIAQYAVAASTATSQTPTLATAPTRKTLAATFAVTGSTATGNAWPAPPNGWAEVSGSATAAIQNPSRLLEAHAEQSVNFTFTTSGLLGTLGFIYEIASTSAGNATVDLSPAAEVEAAQPLATAPRVDLSSAVGAEAAQALTMGPRVDLGPAAEVEAAQALAMSPRVDLGPAADAEAAQALAMAPQVDLSSVVGAEAAQALATAPRVDLTPAADTEAAQALAMSPRVDLGPAAQIEAAQALATAPRVDLSPAADTEAAQALATAPRVDLGPAAETEVAQPLAVVTGGVVDLGPASEAEVAGALTLAKSLGVASATGAGLAQALTTAPQVVLGPASDGDAAGALSLAKLVQQAPALESESAGSLGTIRSLELQPAVSAEQAGPLSAAKLLDLGTVSGIESAHPLTVVVPGVVDLGPASEGEAAGPIALIRAVDLAPSADSGSAGALTIIVSGTGGPASITFDGANKLIIVGPEVGPITTLTAAGIYSRWKDWVTDGNAQYEPAFAQSVGGNDLGTSSLDPYIFIRNDLGWRLRPDERHHELQIVGNLYRQDPVLPWRVPTLGPYTVSIELELSSRAQSIETGVSGLTAQEAKILKSIIPHIWAANE